MINKKCCDDICEECCEHDDLDGMPGICDQCGYEDDGSDAVNRAHEQSEGMER